MCCSGTCSNPEDENYRISIVISWFQLDHRLFRCSLQSLQSFSFCPIKFSVKELDSFAKQEDALPGNSVEL